MARSKILLTIMEAVCFNLRYNNKPCLAAQFLFLLLYSAVINHPWPSMKSKESISMQGTVLKGLPNAPYRRMETSQYDNFPLLRDLDTRVILLLVGPIPDFPQVMIILQTMYSF